MLDRLIQTIERSVAVSAKNDDVLVGKIFCRLELMIGFGSQSQHSDMASTKLYQSLSNIESGVQDRMFWMGPTVPRQSRDERTFDVKASDQGNERRVLLDERNDFTYPGPHRFHRGGDDGWEKEANACSTELITCELKSIQSQGVVIEVDAKGTVYLEIKQSYACCAESKAASSLVRGGIP